MSSKQSSWLVKGDGKEEGSQIDLVVERKDNIVNLCEMKFYNDEYSGAFLHVITLDDLFD